MGSSAGYKHMLYRLHPRGPHHKKKRKKKEQSTCIKINKNRLRTTKSEHRLNVLSLMSLESDILKQLSYEDVTSKSVNIKCRRMPINHTKS